ncbi:MULTISPECIES: hypothetical protein [Muribaculaceae]|jgi:hypothetical protein|uniref:hypothetical protein n=1 Tax=Muribaculaceae TaxID=2005473 RepID=UPI00248BC9D1|nr:MULTISPECIES: hypothetical protein [Muribaculaceae]
MAKSRGMSYRKRVEDINRIYDRHARSGLSNREIWRRYIYPVYAISERTFYNIMNATAGLETPVVASDMPSLFDFMGDNPENQESDERP